MSQGREPLIMRVVPLMLLFVILAGAYNRQYATSALATTLLLAFLAARSWGRHCLDSVGYERLLSEDRVFPGDKPALSLRLSNDKFLPMPWAEVEDRLPQGLEALSEHGRPLPRTAGGRLRLAGSASWKERIVWHCHLECDRRGIYQLGPARVTSGDPFGFFPRVARLGGQTRLVVYPRLISLDTLPLPRGFPMGDVRGERWIFEDPSRVQGVREYRPEDPFRRIHWKATARRQELQVKIHEPTTTLEVALFLALDTFQGQGPVPGRSGYGSGDTRGLKPAATAAVDGDRGGAGTGPHPPSGQPLPPGENRGEGGPAHDSSLMTHDSADPVFEHAVSVAASLAWRLSSERYAVGLYLNGGDPESTGGVELPPGSSQEQIMKVLEMLAGVQALPSMPASSLLAQVGPRLPWGTSVVVVAGALSDPILATLETLRRGGRRPVVLLAGDVAVEGRAGIPIYPVAVPNNGSSSPVAMPAEAAL